MDRPVGPDPQSVPSQTLDVPSPGAGARELMSHPERLAAAVDADPIAQTQALALREAYGAGHVPSVLAAVHAGGPGALADLTQNPEQYGPFAGTDHARHGLTMLAGTLPNMNEYGGINAVLNGIARPESELSVGLEGAAREPRWGQLAASSEVVREVHRGLGGHTLSGLSFREQAGLLKDHFESNRRFQRDPDSGVLSDAPGNVCVDRYVYTEDYR